MKKRQAADLAARKEGARPSDVVRTALGRFGATQEDGQ